MVKIEVIPVGGFLSNCLLVSCTESSEGVIVDAGDEAERIVRAVNRARVKTKAVISTHAHIDHVSALHEVVDALGVPAYMHEKELQTYDRVAAQAAMFQLAPPRRVEIDRLLTDGEQIRVGRASMRVIHAPGHSPGSICLAFPDETPPRIISGDVLFKNSIGRTDLPGGSFDTIMRTLKTVFIPLPDDTVVYPGHGPVTTIGEEKRTNPFLTPFIRNGT